MRIKIYIKVCKTKYKVDRIYASIAGENKMEIE